MKKSDAVEGTVLRVVALVLFSCGAAFACAFADGLAAASLATLAALAPIACVFSMRADRHSDARTPRTASRTPRLVRDDVECSRAA